MNRREFIKRSTMACAAVALLPGRLPAQTDKAAAPASSGAPGTGASKARTLPRENKGTLLTKDTNLHTYDYEMKKKN